MEQLTVKDLFGGIGSTLIPWTIAGRILLNFLIRITLLYQILLSLMPLHIASIQSIAGLLP